MRPIQFAVSLAFAEVQRAYSVSQRVFRTLTGDKDKLEPTSERAVEVGYKDRRLAVMWNPATCRVVAEDVSDQAQCLETLLSALDRINEAAPMGRIANRRFFGHWILPQEKYGFAALERKYREAMVAPNSVSDAAFDSSVVFDIKIDGWILHHQSGPMAPKQLRKEYLRFEIGDLPQAFLFLEASTLDQNAIEYARSEMHSFLTESLALSVEHSRRFEQIWEGRL